MDNIGSVLSKLAFPKKIANKLKELLNKEFVTNKNDKSEINGIFYSIDKNFFTDPTILAKQFSEQGNTYLLEILKDKAKVSLDYIEIINNAVKLDNMDVIKWALKNWAIDILPHIVISFDINYIMSNYNYDIEKVEQSKNSPSSYRIYLKNGIILIDNPLNEAEKFKVTEENLFKTVLTLMSDTDISYINKFLKTATKYGRLDLLKELIYIPDEVDRDYYLVAETAGSYGRYEILDWFIKEAPALIDAAIYGAKGANRDDVVDYIKSKIKGEYYTYKKSHKYVDENNPYELAKNGNAEKLIPILEKYRDIDYTKLISNALKMGHYQLYNILKDLSIKQEKYLDYVYIISKVIKYGQLKILKQLWSDNIKTLKLDFYTFALISGKYGRKNIYDWISSTIKNLNRDKLANKFLKGASLMGRLRLINEISSFEKTKIDYQKIANVAACMNYGEILDFAIKNAKKIDYDYISIMAASCSNKNIIKKLFKIENINLFLIFSTLERKYDFNTIVNLVIELNGNTNVGSKYEANKIAPFYITLAYNENLPRVILKYGEVSSGKEAVKRSKKGAKK